MHRRQEIGQKNLRTYGLKLSLKIVQKRFIRRPIIILACTSPSHMHKTVLILLLLKSRLIAEVCCARTRRTATCVWFARCACVGSPWCFLRWSCGVSLGWDAVCGHDRRISRLAAPSTPHCSAEFIHIPIIEKVQLLGYVTQLYWT
jgi:hypothetical protein